MMNQMFEHGDEAFIAMPRVDVSHIRRKWLDIAYAHTSQAQRLDLYLPDEGESPFPLIVNIHGGGHGDPLFESQENLDRVFRFIDRHVG